MHDQKKRCKAPVDENELSAQKEAHRVLGEAYLGVLQRRTARDYSTDALDASTRVLLEVPEAYTLYNYRREILNHLWHSPEQQGRSPTVWLVEELKLNSQLLLKDFKIYAAFVHRHWIFEQLMQRAVIEKNMKNSATSKSEESAEERISENAHEVLLGALGKEKAQCEKLLNLDERNFHAWNYRRWALHELQRATRLYVEEESDSNCDAVADDSDPALYSSEEAAEIAFTTSKINKNFSNYSAWHQRGITIRSALARAQTAGERSISSSDSTTAFHPAIARDLWTQLQEDIHLLIKAIYCDPNDQSAWFYAPFVLGVFESYRVQLMNTHNSMLKETEEEKGENQGGAHRGSSASAGGAAGVSGDEEAALVRRCSGDLMDMFVDATVELIAEEMRLGAASECYFPVYFLFSLLVRLMKADSVSSNARLRYGSSAPHEWQSVRLTQYSQLVCSRLYEESVSNEACASVCLNLLKKDLCLSDSIRAGMYTQQLEDALRRELST